MFKAFPITPQSNSNSFVENPIQTLPSIKPGRSASTGALLAFRLELAPWSAVSCAALWPSGTSTPRLGMSVVKG